MTQRDAEVLIVGAGPSGLSAAIALRQHGVSTRVVARHRGTAVHPKAHVINARTMELFRQWGFADQVAAASLPRELSAGVGWMTRINGEELGRILLSDVPEEEAAMSAQSAETLRSCPQDILEPILLDAAKSMGVDVDFDTELVAVEQDCSMVKSALRSPTRGTDLGEVTSSYVIAADGAHSKARSLLRLEITSIAPAGHMISVHFSADLQRHTACRPYLLWWIVNAETQGAFVTLDGNHRWNYLFGYDASRQTPQDFTADRCASIIRAAVGRDDLDVDVHSISPWTINISLLEQFRSRRIFFVGDAAHQFPPTAGLGMNTGIQDAHNLAWKLALVCRQQAGDALLDTYDSERRPVAKANAAKSMENALKMATTGALLSDAASLADIEKPSGKAMRERIRAAIPEQRDHFFYQGMTFGYFYESYAIIGDGTRAPELTPGVHSPIARPGSLAPHVWLQTPSGQQVPVIDILGKHFVLLSNGAHAVWKSAAETASQRFDVAIRAYAIGAGGDFIDNQEWRSAYGLGETGAVLIRPDGHVALRVRNADSGTPAQLCGATAQILCRDVEW